jgi:ABC-type glycerol-3-phosphate transport system substrate-binding protein
VTRQATALLALAVAALAACSDDGAGTDTITWWTPNWSQARAEEVARQFESANPGVTVRLEITVSDGLPTRIQTALRSGAPPDVIEAQHGWVVPYAQAGLLAPLDEVLDVREDYVSEALEYDTWDGRLWGLPYRIETHAVLYNKSMFRDAGLDPDRPPDTWDELVATARTLTRRRPDGREQYGYAITGGGEVGNTLFRSLPLIWMNGGDILSADLTRAVVNEPAAVEAVAFYTDMLTRHRVSPPSTLQDDGNASRRLFVAESVAMYQSGQFDIAPIRAENPRLDLGVMLLPRPAGRERAAVLGGWSLIVPRDARHPDLARRFIRFLAEPDRMGYFTDTFPARQSAMVLPRFADPILRPFREMLPYGRRVPPRPDWLQIVQIYFTHVQRVLLGDVTPQTAMDEAAAEMQALLDRRP